MKKQYCYEGKVKASYYEDDDLANAKKEIQLLRRQSNTILFHKRF